jgi:hypothetical protein
MEDDLDAPSDGMGWEGDPFAIVGAENGVAALNGVSMLRFDATTPGGAAAGPDAELSQVVDLSPHAAQIATGRATLQTTGFFNRVDAGPDTDTEFQIDIEALNGGGSVIASSGEAIQTDGDTASWQPHVAGLLLPPATAGARVTLVASEDVVDDAAPPELDGHYADNVRARVLPPLAVANANFEDAGDHFDDDAGWEGDPFSIVGAEAGITPHGGSSMLRFDTTGVAGPGPDTAVNLAQDVDLTEYASLIAGGGASVNVAAFFNRVHVDPQTDVSFVIVLLVRDASAAVLSSIFAPFVSDANPGTWQEFQTSVALPPGSVRLTLIVVGFEDVFNDTVAPELDGHYADDVSVWVSP